MMKRPLRYESKRKSYAYWKDFENLKKELKPIIEELDHFPTEKQLTGIGRSDIATAISRHHGGYRAVRKKMGFKQKVKPHAYWKDFENLKRELEPILEELGYFPTKIQLRKMGRSDIEGAIYTYHGGFSAVRKKMGYELKKNPMGYWKNFENLKKELEPILEELGEFPTQRQLEGIGRGDIVSAINKYHGGYPAVRKKLGYKLKRKPDGYWRDFEKIRKELETEINKLGYFPTQAQLREMGRNDIAGAINKYHGGLNAVREKMGYKTIESTEELLRFVRDYEEPKKVLALGLSDSKYLRDAIDILTRLFPKRIDPNKTMELIDHSIESLISYIGGFKATKEYGALSPRFLESLPSSLFEIKRFEALLFNIARDSYMRDFNRNPIMTLDTISTHVEEIKNPIVKELLKRILKYYKEITAYEIPGIPLLVEKSN